jgi:hypothetical protein
MNGVYTMYFFAAVQPGRATGAREVPVQVSGEATNPGGAAEAPSNPASSTSTSHDMPAVQVHARVALYGTFAVVQSYRVQGA